MKVGYDVEVIFQQVEYGGVLASLVEGRIDLAAHNPSIFTQYTKHNPVLESDPLIEIRGYDALASRTRLRDMVRANELSPVARQLAVKLLDGQDLARNPGLSPELQAPIGELVAKGGLACLKNTDTERAAYEFFGKQPDQFIHDLDPDEGLEALLDGILLS